MNTLPPNPKNITPCKACCEPIDTLASVCPICQTRQKQTYLMQLKEIVKWFAGGLTLISLVIGVATLNNMYSSWQGEQRIIEETVISANMLIASNDFRQAWKLLSQSSKLNPGSVVVQKAQAQLSLVWLRNMFILENETYSQLVEPMVTILARELVDAKPKDASVIKAHLGWIRFLQEKDRKLLQPDKNSIQIVNQLLQNALSDDTDNYFARTMLAYVNMYVDIDVKKSVQHLGFALESVLRQHGAKHEDYEWVREYQWRILTLRLKGNRGTNDENEAMLRTELLRVVNSIRSNQEPHPSKIQSKFVFDNYWRSMGDKNIETLLHALPAQEHLKTFEWLFDKEDNQREGSTSFHFTYNYVHARLLENSGFRERALLLFEQLAENHINKRLDMGVDEAIQRLSGQQSKRAQARNQRQNIKDEPPKNVGLWTFHADTLMDFEPTTIAADIKSAFEFFDDPNREEVINRQEETYVLFINAHNRVKEWLEDKNRAETKYEDNAFENYYHIWQLLGTYALKNKQPDKAIAELSDLYKLMKPIPVSLILQLSKAYNVRFDQRKNEQDKISALKYLAEYVDAKVKYGGALQFDAVKNDAQLASLRSNETYKRLLLGR